MQNGRCCCPGGSTPQQFYRRRSFEVVQFCMGESSTMHLSVSLFLMLLLCCFMVLLDIKLLSVLEWISLPGFRCFVNLSAGNVGVFSFKIRQLSIDHY